jgi:hypothetical protein
MRLRVILRAAGDPSVFLSAGIVAVCKFARDSDIIGGKGKSPQGLGAKDWTKVRCPAARINPKPGDPRERAERSIGWTSRVG